MKRKIKNSKIPWCLRDPYFVPKSKTVRVILFVIVNSILLILFPIMAIFINFPYGYLCWLFLFCFIFFFNRRAFFIHIQRYPLNCYNEYKFNVLKDKLLIKNSKLVLELRKENNSQYIVYIQDKQLKFDMKGCLFPITIIRCFLIRQYLMFHINKNNLISDYMAKNVNLMSSFPNHKDILLEYHNGNKIKNYDIIKLFVTKQCLIDKVINGNGFITWGRCKKRYFVKVSEDMFIDMKC